jgi:hypothetical protein
MRPVNHRIPLIFSVTLFVILALFFGNNNPHVYADYCTGQIKCGSNGNFCSISKDSCQLLEAPCGFGGAEGTCVYGCNLNLPPIMDCGGISNKSTCESASVRDCTSSCSTSTETPCTWVVDPSITPPPGGGGGGCTDNSDCSAQQYCCNGQCQGMDYVCNPSDNVNCSGVNITGPRNGSGHLLVNSTYTLGASYDNLGRPGYHIMTGVVAGATCWNKNDTGQFSENRIFCKDDGGGGKFQAVKMIPRDCSRCLMSTTPSLIVS